MFLEGAELALLFEVVELLVELETLLDFLPSSEDRTELTRGVLVVLAKRLLVAICCFLVLLLVVVALVVISLLGALTLDFEGGTSLGSLEAFVDAGEPLLIGGREEAGALEGRLTEVPVRLCLVERDPLSLLEPEPTNKIIYKRILNNTIENIRLKKNSCLP